MMHEGIAERDLNHLFSSVFSVSSVAIQSLHSGVFTTKAQRHQENLPDFFVSSCLGGEINPYASATPAMNPPRSMKEMR